MMKRPYGFPILGMIALLVPSVHAEWPLVAEGIVPAANGEHRLHLGAILRHPRTAVAFNDRYVYLAVASHFFTFRGTKSFQSS